MRPIAVGSGNDVFNSGQTHKDAIDKGSGGGYEADNVRHGRRLRTTKRKENCRNLRELRRVALGAGRTQTLRMAKGIRRGVGCLQRGRVT